MEPTKKRIRSKEGEAFAVPLEQGGYGVCVIARKRGPIILAYLFGPRHATVPAPEDLDLVPGTQHLALKCGALAIGLGEWPKIGALPGWKREAWPIPRFSSAAIVGDEVVAVDFDEDLWTPAQIHRLPPAELEALASGDTLYGPPTTVALLSTAIALTEQMAPRL